MNFSASEDKRNCPQYPCVRLKRVSVERGSTVLNPAGMWSPTIVDDRCHSVLNPGDHMEPSHTN